MYWLLDMNRGIRWHDRALPKPPREETDREFARVKDKLMAATVGAPEKLPRILVGAHGSRDEAVAETTT